VNGAGRGGAGANQKLHVETLESDNVPGRSTHRMAWLIGLSCPAGLNCHMSANGRRPCLLSYTKVPPTTCLQHWIIHM